MSTTPITPEDFQPGCPLSDVIATAELRTRTPHTPDLVAEHEALSTLSNAMLTGADRILELLVAHAMRLCRAQSAGISLEDRTVDPPVFRWRAVAGRFEPFLNGTMPRDFSPCGETVTRNQTQLMQDPARHYRYARALHMPMAEVLLSPFSVEGRPIGTVWVVAHDDTRKFDREDARHLDMLSRFAGMAVTAIERSQFIPRNR